MIERDVSGSFDITFQEYHILKPSNRLAGWPDRGVQMNSKLVWCELKISKFRNDNKILLDNFEKEQASFMYKWQRNNGGCFLLVGLIDRRDKFAGYTIIRPNIYRDWLNVRQRYYSMDDITIMAEMNDILEWFKYTYV